MRVPIEKIHVDGEWIAPQELVDSIRIVRQLQPLLVIGLTDGNYDLVDGRRRLAAMRELGFSDVEIKVVSTDVGFALLGLAGNVHSSNPLSEARMIESIGDLEMVRSVTGMTKAVIAARLKLLNLSQEFQGMLERGELTLSAAKELVRLPAVQQQEAYDRACSDDKKPTARRIKEAVRSLIGEMQPQLPVGLPVIIGETVIDPMAIAARLRVILQNNSDKLSCDDYDIITRAAEIVEGL